MFYCRHCGNDVSAPDVDGNSNRLCPDRDGDVCEPKLRRKLPKLPPKPFKMPRAALEHVIDLATYGKIDRTGEPEGLEKDDVEAIIKVCAAFRIALPDSSYFPKKKKKKKR
jgi:hypothetical protein